jgi:hypothetical protein
LKEIGAKVIDISKKKIFINGKWQEQENELLEIEGLYPNIKVKTVKCICPSTKRTFFLDVPPDTTDANEAIAWTFNITKKQYEEMTVET